MVPDHAELEDRWRLRESRPPAIRVSTVDIVGTGGQPWLAVVAIHQRVDAGREHRGMESWPEPSPDAPITAAEVEQEMRRQDVVAEARTLSALSRTIGAFLTAIGVLGVVGGAIIAVVKPSEDSPFSDGSHVVFGVVVMVGSILQIPLCQPDVRQLWLLIH